MRIELDTFDEQRDSVVLHAEACRRMVERKYNTKVRPKSFQEGDLVCRKTGDAWRVPASGKFATKWDGPLKIVEDLQNGAYRLSLPYSRPLHNTWNTSHLKFYFS